MSCGSQGKKVSEAVRKQVEKLLGQGLTVDQVYQRVALSKSMIRNIRTESSEAANGKRN
jgi:transposase